MLSVSKNELTNMVDEYRTRARVSEQKIQELEASLAYAEASSSGLNTDQEITKQRADLTEARAEIFNLRAKLIDKELNLEQQKKIAVEEKLSESEQDLEAKLQITHPQLNQQPNLVSDEQQISEIEDKYNVAVSESAILREDNEFLKQKLAEYIKKDADQSSELLQAKANYEEKKKLEQHIIKMDAMLQGSIKDRDELITKLENVTLKKTELAETKLSLEQQKRVTISEKDLTNKQLQVYRSEASEAIKRLKESKQDLEAQLQIAHTQIKQQQKKLISVEQQKVEIEDKSRDLHTESIILQGGNKLLKEQLAEYKRKEAEYSDKVIQAETDAQDKQKLEQHITEMDALLMQNIEDKDKLSSVIENATAKIKSVTNDRDQLETKCRELEAANQELLAKPEAAQPEAANQELLAKPEAAQPEISKQEAVQQEIAQLKNIERDYFEENPGSHGKVEFADLLAPSAPPSEYSTRKEIISRKTFSPNRSTLDVPVEINTKDMHQEIVEPETTWIDDAKASKYEAPNESNRYKRILNIIASLIAVSAVVIVFFNPIQDYLDRADDTSLINSPEKPVGDIYGASSGIVSPSNGNYSPQLKQKALDLLKKFHLTKNLNEKASLCLLPVRTLADMEKYYAINSQNDAVIDVDLSPNFLIENNMKFIKAKVKTDPDNTQNDRSAFFVLNKEGNLKLDWHSYVYFESTPWENYLNQDDKNPKDWHLTISFNGNLHPNFPEDEYEALSVKSWHPNAVSFTNAFLSKKHPMYDKLKDSYSSGKDTFIFKAHHLGDLANSLVIDEVVSLGRFYENDLDLTMKYATE